MQTIESQTSSIEVIAMHAVHFFQELQSAGKKYCVNQTKKENYTEIRQLENVCKVRHMISVNFFINKKFHMLFETYSIHFS